MNKVIHGDCLEVLKTLPDNSVDAVVTDPPYGLSFMGKKWDYDVPKEEVWRECLRVLKHGGYLLAFAGTRTQHRMAVRIEDAGFEIRDMIAWVYGSGFPKSLNIGKAVDKVQGNEREEYIDENFLRRNPTDNNDGVFDSNLKDGIEGAKRSKGTSPWEGWGTALKPSLEPITVARKPLSEKTVAENCLKWGVGGINIDASRVGTELITTQGGDKFPKLYGTFKPAKESEHFGRFPSNLIHDGSDEVVELFPNTTPSKSGGKSGKTAIWGDGSAEQLERGGFNDSGSAARFFYCAKASKAERNRGLDGTCTVKYNTGICTEENMVLVQLLRKVTLGTGIPSFNIDESGESITVQCQSASLSTIKMKINEIIDSKIFNSLMHSLTSEYTADANSETVSGGSHVASVESLRKYLLAITNGQMELARGVSRVALKTLSSISASEWEKGRNFHATVKPIALMEYLVKLVSREGAVILDPFAGSGSTLLACKNLSRQYIGIEREQDYINIINARLGEPCGK